MMFGAPAAVAPPANKNQTMMFGVPGVSAAPPPPAPPPPAKNQTMMFGTAGSNAAPPPPANVRSTMMFGTPASNSAPPPAAPAPSSKATMVFGASPATAPPPPAKNTTMMFGTPASNAASAAPPPAPPPSSKQTMVFGSPAPVSSPAAKQTMVFGTAASNSAASNPPPPVSSLKQTMVFGAAPAAPAPAKNQTMMFGTPASNAVEPPMEETILEQPGQSSRTVLFGTAAPPPPEPAPAKNQTMMFGRPAIPKVTAGAVELAGYAADEGQPNESTVRVDVAQVIEEHAESEAQPQVHRHDRTQRFAMTDTGTTPPEGQTSLQDRHNRTQLFAMSSPQESTVPVGEAIEDKSSSVFVGDTTLPPGALPAFERPSRGGTDLNTTLPPDGQLLDPPGVSLLHDPANMTPPEAVRAAEGPVATTLPNLPVMMDRPMAPLALELPPEPMGSPQDLRLSQQNQQQAANEDAAALRAVRGGGAGRAIVVILIIVALALAGVLVYRLFGRELLGKAVPVDALRSTEQSLATLRFDDQVSQEKALNQLVAVLAEHPGLPEAQGAIVIVSALRYDDVQGQVNRGTASLRSLKASGAAADRITAAQAQLASYEAGANQLKAQLEAAVTKMQALMPTVEPGTSTQLALLRADGLARGVLGDGEALTRAVAFRQSTATEDDWVDLIEPEYALNGGSSVDEAIAQLVALKARGANSTFLRPYVLLARLQLKKGEPKLAREELEAVSTMNARHEIARELLASLGKP